MKIIKIIPQKFKKQYKTLYFDGDYRIKLHEELILQHGLKEGLDVSEEKLIELTVATKKKEATDYAYLSLSLRVRSEKEMLDRLKKKGFSSDIVKTVIEELKLINLS